MCYNAFNCGSMTVFWHAQNTEYLRIYDEASSILRRKDDLQMHKKILRILSLALAILILFSVLPQQSSATESEVARIRKQITSTYRAAQRNSGRYSFNGWCATMVNWHLYLMGITAEMTGNDGNMEYDYYKNQTFTSGGYRVRAYSANKYSLKDALYAICENGTVNAYNILVGFQRTNTTAGRRYGHACFVHAIIDGIIYFSESYNTAFAGTYYREGAVIACTIEEFAGYYANWTTYEGVIYFGLKTYADECTYYSTNFYGNTNAAVPFYSAPCLSDTDDRSEIVGQLQNGERVQVTGLYLNTVGEYWYQLSGAHRGYVPADSIDLIAMDYSDISVVGLGAPNNLKKGVGFNLKGEILAKYNNIYTVRALVYNLDGESPEQVLTATSMADSQSYQLNGSALSNKLGFRKLPVGSYQYDLAIVVGSYYVQGGELKLQWHTVDLWSSLFRIVSTRGGTYNVTFDPNGGTTETNRVEIVKNDPLGYLPSASKDGMLFAGWYTAADGGEPVTEEMAVTGNTTLYAHWEPDNNANGWFLVDGAWRYFVDGQVHPGLLKESGLVYYLNTDGTAVTGWVQVQEHMYYFGAAGVMQTGWVEIKDETYYFAEDGAMYIGWITLDGKQYLLGGNGSLQKGWITINGKRCYLGEDGALQIGWSIADDQNCFFGEDGGLVLTLDVIDGVNHYTIYDKAGAAGFDFGDCSSIVYYDT